MRMDWLPTSAALLVTGAMALALGSVLSVGGGEGAESTVQLVEANDGRWLAAAAVYFLASVALVLGLPALMSVFRRGQVTAAASAVALTAGFVGLAGYAMLLVFFRALVQTHALRGEVLDEVTSEGGLQVFLYGWVVAFVIGELLLMAALLQAGRSAAPAWVPVALAAHVVSLLLSPVLPEGVSSVTVLLLSVALSGVAVRAARPARVGAHGWTG